MEPQRPLFAVRIPAGKLPSKGHEYAAIFVGFDFG